jgi:hypothetical protein
MALRFDIQKLDILLAGLQYSLTRAVTLDFRGW